MKKMIAMLAALAVVGVANAGVTPATDAKNDSKIGNKHLKPSTPASVKATVKNPEFRDSMRITTPHADNSKGDFAG